MFSCFIAPKAPNSIMQTAAVFSPKEGSNIKHHVFKPEDHESMCELVCTQWRSQGEVFC